MESYPRLTVENNIEHGAECYYRYVYGSEDIFYPHKHNFYEIFVTVSGIVRHWFGGVEQELLEGSLVFIRPDDTHGYIYNNAESHKTEYINLAFTKEVAESLFTYLAPDFPIDALLSSQTPPTVVLNATSKMRVLSQLNELNTLNWKNKQGLKLRVKTILADIFVQNFYNMPMQKASDMPLWFVHLLSEMTQPDNFITGTQRMIDLSQKSREHLSRVIKKYLNISLTQYVNNLRLNYAANLLLNSNIPIIEICYMSGFQNLGYFYRTFKAQYNLSPAQFSAQHKKTGYDSNSISRSKE